MGKPIVEAEFDVADAAHCFEYYGGMATKIHGETLEVPDNALSMVVREPVGVVGQIIPWNYPLLMAAWKLGARAGGRLHGGAEAGRADAAVGADARGDLSSRSICRRASSTSSPATGPTAGAALVDRSARRQDRVHRRRRHRRARHPRRGRDHQADVDRARRQEPQHRVRRRRLRGRGRRRAVRRLREPGRGLLRRIAAARASVRSTTACCRRSPTRSAASRSAIR